MQVSKRVFSALTVLFFFSWACTPASIRNVGTWVDRDKTKQLPGAAHKVFIAVMTQNEEIRFTLENDLAAAAEAKGLSAVKSLDVFGGILAKTGAPSASVVLEKVRAQGCDLIFTVALLDENSQTYYHPGSAVAYTSYPVYGNFDNFYGYGSVVYSPGYYSTTNTYYLTSNLYESRNGDLLVSMQTKAVDPPVIEKSSKKFTQALVDELQKQGFMKGKK